MHKIPIFFLFSAALVAQQTQPLTNQVLITPVIQGYTVANLPPAASKPVGAEAVVTDGTSGTPCTVGGGATLALCRNSGSAWVAIGGGGTGDVGGGSSLTEVDTIPRISAAADWTSSSPRSAGGPRLIRRPPS